MTPATAPDKVSSIRHNASEAVLESIRAGISSGRWAPGGKLPSERDLAEQLNVSRPVVREAVHVLIGQGLIEARPRRGLYVRAASTESLGDSFERLIGSNFDRIDELLDLRRVLERRAAFLAARFATPEDIGNLERILKQMETALRSGETGEDDDVQFHGAIALAAGNTVLTHLMATLHSTLARAARLLASRLMAGDHYREGMIEHHALILAAIKKGDAKAAAAAMDAHFDFVAREFSHYRRKVGDV